MYLLDNIKKKVFVFGALLIFFRVFIWSTLILNFVLTLTSFVLAGHVFNLLWNFMPKNFVRNIEGKAVFITGCDTGFGHMFAKKLDALGVLVFAGCLFSEGEGAKELQRSCSDKLKIIQLDVTQDDQVENAVRTVTSILEGRREELWAVVNNAGIGNVGEIEWTPIDVYQKTFDVNVLGQVRITKVFLPLLRKSKGRIVSLTSVLGRASFPFSSAYCMSKHAAVSFSDSLRQEVMKWSISVHTVEPWGYRTDLLDGAVIESNIKGNWGKTPNSVREEYGVGYLDKVKRTVSLLLLTSRPKSAMNEVIDCLVDATIGREPKVRYIPGIVGLICTIIACIIPTELLNFIIYIISPTVSRSKPESQKSK
ncbi:short-chain dehydrogenase/reductase family 9C member 7-like [Periplaneta americana]|uniref:short-chain dehydrogenase/reductase family 9C member 7-like n=1 Tax=Periplaneta americana TaxID=6978 RepID=UPI0037E8A813